MPKPFPQYIKDYLKQNIPSTHRMWWLRCQIMQVEQIQIRPVNVNGQSLAPVTYYRFALRDVDAPAIGKMGYVVDVQGGDNNDFRVNDRVSLFGHDLLDAQNLGEPRFFYDHENEQSAACYPPKFADQNLIPVPLLKVSAPGSARDKGAKMVSGFLKRMGGNPETLEGTLPGGTDLREYYQVAASEINKFVKENPDDVFPCVNPRDGAAGLGPEFNDDW